MQRFPPAHEEHGAPLAIARVLKRDDDGNVTLTAGQRFLQMTALGNPVRVAAAAAGMSWHSAIEIVKQGVRLEHYIERKRRTEANLTPREREILRFSREFTTASGESIARLSALLTSVIQGGGQVRTTTTTTRQVGDTIETTTNERVEHVGPDPATLRWFMGVRWPAEFGTKIQVTVSDAEDPFTLTDDDRLALILEAARADADASPAGDGVIDVTETTTNGDHPERGDPGTNGHAV